MRRNGHGLRRWLAAGLLAAAVAVGLQVLAPEPVGGVSVLVAARDVPAGTTLSAGDVRRVRWTPSAVPAVAVRDGEVSGEVVASALSAGELLTTTRLLGPGLLAGRDGDEVAAPVRLADAQVSALLRPGARIDVLAAVDGDRTARTVARGATVLAVPAAAAQSRGLLTGTGDASGAAADSVGGGLVLLAVDASTAAELAQAAARGVLSVVLR